MYIAIVSDTHGSIDRLDQILKNLKEAGIKHLIHAGDGIVYGIEEVFAKYPEIHIYYSLGNCDVNEEIIEKLENMPHVQIRDVIKLKLEKLTIGVSHIEGMAQNKLKGQNIDIFCHGHTHRPKAEKRDGKVILNPGALCEDGNYFLLNLPELKLEVRNFNDKLTTKN